MRCSTTFSLDAHVPADHLLRSIDRFVDLSEVRRELAPFYSSMGRPSIDPELMIRMLIVGYCFGIRSERRLCEEVHLNLAYRWFCRLGLDGDVPDHSTFSKNRHGRFRESDLLRQRVRDGRAPLHGGRPGRRRRLCGRCQPDQGGRQPATRRRGRSNGSPPEATSRAVDEYLAVLDDAAFGAATRGHAEVHLAGRSGGALDRRSGGQAFFAYSTNYLIDLDNAIIVDVEATTAIRQAEVTAAKRMIERAKDRFDLYPARLAGDSAYGSAEMLGWLVHEQRDRAARPGVRQVGAQGRHLLARRLHLRSRGRRLPSAPAARCSPATGTLVNDGATLLYRASKHDCDACALKPRCCPKAPARKVPRSIHEGARDMARDIAKTEEGLTSRRQRKKIEMLFAHLKRILRLDRLRLRGPNGARDEFHLAATAQNLRKLAKLIPMPLPSQREAVGLRPIVDTPPPHARRSPRRLLQRNRRKTDLPTALADVCLSRVDSTRSAQHLLIFLDEEVGHGDVTDLVHGAAEGRAVGALEERSECCGYLAGAGKERTRPASSGSLSSMVASRRRRAAELWQR